MRTLSEKEIKQADGGFLNFIIGTAIGLISYSINKKIHHEPMTVQGATMAAGIGAATSGLGGVAVGAAGGGIAANVAWRPGFVALNAAGQQIAAQI